MSYTEVVIGSLVRRLAQLRCDGNAWGDATLSAQACLDACPKGHVWTPKGIDFLQSATGLSSAAADVLLGTQLWADVRGSRERTKAQSLESFFTEVHRYTHAFLHRPLWLGTPALLSKPGYPDNPRFLDPIYRCAIAKAVDVSMNGRHNFTLNVQLWDTNYPREDVEGCLTRYPLVIDFADSVSMGAESRRKDLEEFSTPCLQMVKHLLDTAPTDASSGAPVRRWSELIGALLHQRGLATHQEALLRVEQIKSGLTGLVQQIPAELLRVLGQALKR